MPHLHSKSFDFERTWWRLFQKRVVHTKFDIYVFIIFLYNIVANNSAFLENELHFILSSIFLLGWKESVMNREQCRRLQNVQPDTNLGDLPSKFMLNLRADLDSKPETCNWRAFLIKAADEPRYRFRYHCFIYVAVFISFRGPLWPWSYGSWIYNYMYLHICNQCLSPLMLWVRISIRARCTTLCDKGCQWLAIGGQWFSLDPPVSSTQKTDRYDMTEIFLKVALNTINQL